MSIKEILGTVIQKVAANKVNVNNALRQARDTIVQADEETVAAAKVLIKKFGNPQGALQIVQNVHQIDALQDTSDEMDAMIAGLQSLLVDEGKLVAAEAQLSANRDAAFSPLSGAAGGNVPYDVDDPAAAQNSATQLA